MVSFTSAAGTKSPRACEEFPLATATMVTISDVSQIDAKTVPSPATIPKEDRPPT